MNTPAGGVALLALTTFLARLLFADSLGLGIDESYMVAAGRTLQLSYFDHPPLAWWMAWAAAYVAGSETELVVRLPFVLLFALSTWLMFRFATALFGTCAGLWAAVLLNAAPVFGVTTGTWVLPDGPLIAALLGAATCLVHALRSQGRSAWGWWLGAGACAGLALCSKYSAVLTLAGAALFLVTEPRSRHWLARPHPYAAGAVALALFSPVLVWNAEHGWVSLLFQGGRAGGAKLHPFGSLSTFAGEAVFLLPWIWAPLIACGAVALWRGPADRSRWLLACLALPPILLFAVLSTWTHVLFHWAAPGYLMLFPLLGDLVGRHRRTNRGVRIWLAATAITVTTGAVFVGSEVRFNWLPDVAENFALGKDPDVDAVDWTSVRDDLARRGLLGRAGLVVAATRWRDAGKLDYALRGRMPVICLGDDPREYGITNPYRGYRGEDVLIASPRSTRADIVAKFGPLFDSVEALEPAIVEHAGRPAMLVPLFLGHQLHAQISMRLLTGSGVVTSGPGRGADEGWRTGERGRS